MTYSILSWKDYWELYNQLTELLRTNNEELVIVELQEAQKYVNGMTDGWHNFQDAFEKVILSNRSRLTAEQIELAEYLLRTLRQSLKKR